MDAHNAAVEAIATRVKAFHHTKQPFRIFHGTTNSTRRSQYSEENVVDISALNKVLVVNEENRTALVEPNVPMDRLVAATLAHRLVPPVVMEFPGITAGGGYSGTSAESSSFRHGFFDETILSIEIILGNGDIITSSRDEHPELFFGAASSFGTMGIVTLLKIDLLNAKPYVALTYHPITDASHAVEKFKQFTSDMSIDYLDGIMFSETSGVILAGRLTHEIEGLAIQRFSSASDPWFYLHVEKKLQRGTPTTEAIPLEDYLFRYDRGGFWVGKYAFQYFLTPFNNLMRRILDRFMHTRVMYHALHKSGHSELYIIQDVAVPYDTAYEFVHYLDQTFGHYPLWLCPLLQKTVSPMSPRSIAPKYETTAESNMLLNFGIWGPGPRGRDRFVGYNRDLERKVYELGGKKWLYAHAYYTEEEFWRIYDWKSYNALRQKYFATHLPTIYDKVKVDVNAERQAVRVSWITWFLALFWSIWPISGVYGVLHTLVRTNYLMQRPKRVPRTYKWD